MEQNALYHVGFSVNLIRPEKNTYYLEFTLDVAEDEEKYPSQTLDFLQEQIVPSDQRGITETFVNE